MKGVIALLQDFEKLVYKILVWVILVPKTIFYVVLDPLDAPKYVDRELTQDKDSPFDEYMSPVILLLVVAFLPALAFNSLPKFGVNITSPAEANPTSDNILLFESQADFKSAATDMAYVHTWVVEKVQADGSYPVVASDVHIQNESFEAIDANTVTDRFVYAFSEGAGDYYVNVIVDKIDVTWEEIQNNPNLDWTAYPIVETQVSYIIVNIPVRQGDTVLISNAGAKEGGSATSGEQDVVNFSERIKQEETIFLALALMLPPLLFAFAVNIFRKKKEQPTDKSAVTTQTFSKLSPYVEIGEESLKNSFYVQCYYFSPLSLAVWGTYYASYFYTEDALLFSGYISTLQIMLLPLLLAVVWFLRTEVKYISAQRETPTWRATLITLACIALIGVGIDAILTFEEKQDIFRLWAIRAFPIAAVLLILSYVTAWNRRRKRRNESIRSWNVAGMTTIIVLFLGAVNLIPFVVDIANAPALSATQPESTQLASTSVAAVPATATLEFTPTAQAEIMPTQELALPSPSQELATPSPSPVAVDTPTPTLSPFYTDEFNGDLATWFDFMTSGDPRMVERNIELGRLTLKLFRLEDKLPWYYLIKDSFTYTDVKVEAVVINKGNNTNGVSLICRYSDIGWYEFVISNSGSYQIYAVDNAGVVNQGYNPFIDANSGAIQSGPGAVNVYTITCQGDKLELSINGRQVRTINDKKFNFASGKIGLGVSSPEKLPTWIEFESLTVSEP